MQIDYEKWERLQRQEKALSSEVEVLKEEVSDRRRAEVMQLELVRRAVANQGLRARRNIQDFMSEYARDPAGIIAGLRAEDSPALVAAEEHQRRIAALTRSQSALADAERKLNAFRPSYFAMRAFVANAGAAA
jgi:hypothetical protein